MTVRFLNETIVTTYYGDGRSITVPNVPDIAITSPVHKVSDPIIVKHVIPALRGLARKRCHRSNCGTVCLCEPCHARKALAVLDPDWRPR